ALVLEPAMTAAIDVQQHAGQRSPFPSLAMHPALAASRYQPGPLQSLFYPGVAQLYSVLRPQLLVKMLHVQIEIAIPIQSQDLLHRRQGNALGGRLSSPPVEQPVVARLFQPLPPAPHRPIADANNLGRLP